MKLSSFSLLLLGLLLDIVVSCKWSYFPRCPFCPFSPRWHSGWMRASTCFPMGVGKKRALPSRSLIWIFTGPSLLRAFWVCSLDWWPLALFGLLSNFLALTEEVDPLLVWPRISISSPALARTLLCPTSFSALIHFFIGHTETWGRMLSMLRVAMADRSSVSASSISPLQLTPLHHFFCGGWCQIKGRGCPDLPHPHGLSLTSGSPPWVTLCYSMLI